MKKIDLKCENSVLWGDGQTNRRYKQTLKRVRPFVVPNVIVHDCGGRNQFGENMAKDLNLTYIARDVDLNYAVEYIISTYAFCFEVLEHLMNPLLFLNNIKGTHRRIFITFPYSPIVPLQGKNHFHEMTLDQFYTLTEEAGLRIVHHDSFRNYLVWWKYFCGFRPLIKLAMQILGLSKIHFFVLERK